MSIHAHMYEYIFKFINIRIYVITNIFIYLYMYIYTFIHIYYIHEKEGKEGGRGGVGVTVTAESKILRKNRESPSDVCICAVSTQQWSSTQIDLFKRTCQSARIDTVTGWQEVSEVLGTKTPLFEGVQQPRKSPQNPSNAFSDALLMCVCFLFCFFVSFSRFHSRCRKKSAKKLRFSWFFETALRI